MSGRRARAILVAMAVATCGPRIALAQDAVIAAPAPGPRAQVPGPNGWRLDNVPPGEPSRALGDIGGSIVARYVKNYGAGRPPLPFVPTFTIQIHPGRDARSPMELLAFYTHDIRPDEFAIEPQEEEYGSMLWAVCVLKTSTTSFGIATPLRRKIYVTEANGVIAIVEGVSTLSEYPADVKRFDEAVSDATFAK